MNSRSSSCLPRLASILAIAAFLQGCASAAPSYVAESAFAGFRAITPRPHSGTNIYKGGKLTFVAWDQLTPDQIRDDLKIQTSAVYTEKIDASGKVTYGPAAVSAEAGSHLIYMDYMKFRPENVLADQKVVGTALVEVGLRTRIRVVTNTQGLDLGGLFSIGVAAKRNQLRGELSVEVVGLDSKDVTLLVPLTADLSQESLQGAMLAIASIKAKLFDPDVKLRPYVLAVRKEVDSDLPTTELLKALR